jgi:hypothetical protein
MRMESVASYDVLVPRATDGAVFQFMEEASALVGETVLSFSEIGAAERYRPN